MRLVKFFIALLLAACMLTVLSSCSSKKSVVGSWKDVQDEYYVVFDDSGSYRDSIYNLSLNYESHGNDLAYYTAAGDMIYISPEWTMRGHLRVYLGDSYRELERVDSISNMFDWSLLPKFKTRNAETGYSLLSAVGVQSDLYLTSDKQFLYQMSSNVVEFSGSIQGLYALSDNSRDYMLYYDGGNSLEVLRASPYGLYLGALPLVNDGTVLVEKSYANMALNQERGYRLDGVIKASQGGITYTFTMDSRCVKSASEGDTLQYNYYISTEGLVTLLPLNGILEPDYMYYDAEQNKMYRLVYQRNSWYDYVAELSTQIDFETSDSVDWKIPASLTTPSDRFAVLPVAYSVESCILSEIMYDLDVLYTIHGAQHIREVLARIQTDEAARKEYEDSIEAEQTRLRKQLEAEQREREKVKALMDARVEAELAGGVVSDFDTPGYSTPSTTPTPSTTDDLSWLDAFLASLETQPSYDQDANSSSPVVNTGGDMHPNTPESATSTDPPSTDEGEPDTTVSQYDPAFYVDFVCTCVNCHVQALPVELNADDVLLVDATVIEPGTYLSLEGYGMVVARESGGYTSGQTAVLYSNSHNAVNRFPSGMYNVYKVVG